ncbi:MAG: hypothetical protein ACRDQZ_04720 [Mycobacteriales bacterium]
MADVTLGAVAPAIDEMELLASMQEMLERARGLKESLAVAEARKASEEEVLDALYDWYFEWYFEALGDARQKQGGV